MIGAKKYKGDKAGTIMDKRWNMWWAEWADVIQWQKL